MAPGRSGSQSQDARHRQRRMAVPGAAREGRNGMAIRHRRGKGRSAGAADRTQRARGDRDLPSLRHRAAALRAAGTRRQARGPVREEVSERSGQGERPVLAGGARPEAESARRSGGAGGGEGAPARHERRPALPVSRLLLQDPDRAGSGRAPAEPRAMSSRARCLAGSRSSPGQRSTTSPAS